VWRVGRAPDPINFPDPPKADDLDYPRAGNRFDSPTENFSVCYFATDLRACFGETLSRFRPNPALAEATQEDDFMQVGEVPADWRNQRIAVRANFVPNKVVADIRFLDVEALKTRRALEGELAPLLAYYGYSELDIPTVRGGSADHAMDRQVGVRPARRGRKARVRRYPLPVATQHGLGMLGRLPRRRDQRDIPSADRAWESRPDSSREGIRFNCLLKRA
jgi:hypothetical protein